MAHAQEAAPSMPTVKLRVVPELVEEWASRDVFGHRLRWTWGEPDSDGFHTPTVTVLYDDAIGDHSECCKQ